MTWFNIIKTEDFDEALSILNRPMKVEEWMKPNLTPHQQKSCCEYTKEKFALLRIEPHYKDITDDFAEEILNSECDALLELLEEFEAMRDSSEGGLQILNHITRGEATIGELDSVIKISMELLKFWRWCEEESTDKRGIAETTWQEENT